MPRKKFHCRLCKRSFAMAAHLARHMSGSHGRRKAGGTRVRKLPGRKAKGALPESSDARVRLLTTMEAYHHEIQGQCEALTNQARAVAAAMQAITGDQKAGSSSRQSSAVEPYRPGALKSYIVRVLSEAAQPLGPGEIGRRVRRAGYRTKAKDLTRAVTNALPELKNVKRVDYGQYGLAR